MFGIGFFELVVIAVVALVFVGPKRLPEVMKQAGKFFVHIRRTANDVRGTFEGVMKDAEDEIRKEEIAALKALTSKPTTAPTAGATPALTDGTTVAQPIPYDPHFNPHHGHQEPHPGHNADGTLIANAPDHKTEPTNG